MESPSSPQEPTAPRWDLRNRFAKEDFAAFCNCAVESREAIVAEARVGALERELDQSEVHCAVAIKSGIYAPLGALLITELQAHVATHGGADVKNKKRQSSSRELLRRVSEYRALEFEGGLAPDDHCLTYLIVIARHTTRYLFRQTEGDGNTEAQEMTRRLVPPLLDCLACHPSLEVTMCITRFFRELVRGACLDLTTLLWESGVVDALLDEIEFTLTLKGTKDPGHLVALGIDRHTRALLTFLDSHYLLGRKEFLTSNPKRTERCLGAMFSATSQHFQQAPQEPPPFTKSSIILYISATFALRGIMEFCTSAYPFEKVYLNWQRKQLQLLASPTSPPPSSGNEQEEDNNSSETDELLRKRKKREPEQERGPGAESRSSPISDGFARSSALGQQCKIPTSFMEYIVTLLRSYPSSSVDKHWSFSAIMMMNELLRYSEHSTSVPLRTARLNIIQERIPKLLHEKHLESGRPTMDDSSLIFLLDLSGTTDACAAACIHEGKMFKHVVERIRSYAQDAADIAFAGTLSQFNKRIRDLLQGEAPLATAAASPRSHRSLFLDDLLSEGLFEAVAEVLQKDKDGSSGVCRLAVQLLGIVLAECEDRSHEDEERGFDSPRNCSPLFSYAMHRVPELKAALLRCARANPHFSTLMARCRIEEKLPLSRVQEQDLLLDGDAVEKANEE